MNYAWLSSDVSTATHRLFCVKEGPHVDDASPVMPPLGAATDKQEVKRIFTTMTTFGLAASMVSVVLGIIPLYSYSLRTGGEWG